MKFLLAALLGLSLTLTACENLDTKDDPSKDTSKVLNETDYSVCGITTAPHTIQGNWQRAQRQGPFHFITTFSIQNNNVLVTNECRLDDSNLNLRAQVSVPAQYDNANFEPLRAATDSREINDNNLHFSCQASIQAVRMPYRFQGNCLVFFQPGNSDEMVLVPR